MSHKITRRGFTLIELIVALTLFGLVTGSIYGVLRTNQLTYQRQVAQIDMNNTARTTLSVLRNDLRDLDAGDPLGGDILAMGGDSLVYRVTRSLLFLCQPPTATTITVFSADSLRFPKFGWSLSSTMDTLLVYTENDTMSVGDNQWARFAISGSPAAGTACPGGQSSYTITLTGGTLTGVDDGAPVRAMQMWKLKTYADGNGDWWLGAQQLYNTGSASALQPIVGPLNGATGMSMVYYDADGNATTTPSAVRRVAISVTSRSDGRVMTQSGLAYATDGLSTVVTLRNNPAN
jgi:prepilin-type N-terminal cleavage/methylation domain-containing protein